MLHRFSRTELLIGPEGLAKLVKSKVGIFGVGGVGTYAAEALARAGVGHLVLVDYDDVCLTNINRQIHALSSTIGKSKVELMAERVKEINPKIIVEPLREFYLPDNEKEIVDQSFDYVIDAMDTVSAKLHLIKHCFALGVPVVSAMGAGNKLDPTQLRVDDISKTAICPLAKVVRRELRKMGIKKGLKVVYSTETPKTPLKLEADCRTDCVCTNHDAKGNCAKRRQIPGSISFVPSTSGLFLASVVVRDLVGY